MPPPPMPMKRPKIEKPKSLKEVPAYLKKTVGGFFFRLFYIISLVFEANPLILISMVLLCIFDGVLPVIGAYISKDLLNAVSNAIFGERQSAAGSIFETVINDPAFKSIAFLLINFFIYSFVTRIVSRVNAIVEQIAGERVSNHIKLKIMKKAASIDNSSFDKPEFYEKMENANREASMRPIHILTSTFGIVSKIISMVSFIVILWGLSHIAPLIIIVMALPSAFVSYFFRNSNFRYMRMHSKERREMEYFSSSLVNKDNIKEMRLMDLSDTFIDRYQNAFVRYYKGLKKIIYKEGFVSSIVSLVSLFANCLLFAYVAYKVVYGNMQIGDYSLYTGALNSISAAVTYLIASTATIYEGTLFIDNMLEFMKEKATIVPSVNPPAVPQKHTEHTIEFRHVSFSYPGIERRVLDDVNFTLKTGESMVLVGLNGAGKSTLIKLLVRLYDVSDGEILFDGKNIKEYDVKEYHDLFGIIFQDFGKYAVSVADNIAFGDVHKEKTEERVIAAAVKSSSAPYIEKLPKKYDTPLMRIFEEDGIELSIGQWQKLSIARAFYKDSDVLILDEPTASLDALAEAEVFNELAELCHDKISIFVSHRLSSATLANCIVVIDGGTVCEIGSHAELMKKKGTYYNLFTTQAKHYIENSDEIEKKHTHDFEKIPPINGRPFMGQMPHPGNRESMEKMSFGDFSPKDKKPKE